MFCVEFEGYDQADDYEDCNEYVDARSDERGEDLTVSCWSEYVAGYLFPAITGRLIKIQNFEKKIALFFCKKILESPKPK